MTGGKKPTAWMPFYIAAYRKKTARLTCEQHGAYRLLLDELWVCGSAPDDDVALAQITRLSLARWRKQRPVLEPFFRVEAGCCWRHERVEEEREKAVEITRVRRVAGAEGARARWQNHRKEDGKPMANAMANAWQATSQNDAPSHSLTDSTSPPDSHIEPYGSHSFSERERDPVIAAFDGWNTLAMRLRVLPRATKLTARRRREIAARLHDGGPDGWVEALHAVEASPLCRGENDRGWRADLDFVCQAKSYQRLREGFYGPKPVIAAVPSFERTVPAGDGAPVDWAAMRARLKQEQEATDG